MNNNPAPDKFFVRIRKLVFFSMNTGPALAWTGAFLLCFLVVLLNITSSRNLGGNIEEFEVDKVAERDIIAGQAVSYEDKEATRLRIEARERLVPPVFRFSRSVTEEQLERWKRFAALTESRPAEESADDFALAVQSEFPGEFSGEVLYLLYQSGELAEILDQAGALLRSLLEQGLYSAPRTGLEHLNPDVAEVIRSQSTRTEQERISSQSMVTPANVETVMTARINSGSRPEDFARFAPPLLKPFLKENVFYSPEDTQQRIIAARAEVEPVIRNIEPGKRIIRKGFVVTREEMEELLAVRTSLPGVHLPLIFANLLYLLLLFGLLCNFCGAPVLGRDLSDRESYLTAGLSALYITGSVMVKSISLESIPASIMVPTALVIILPSILVHPRLALLLAMALPLGAFVTGSFSTQSYFFALVSGTAAAYSLRGAEKRMDLVKAGLIIAAANLAAMLAILLAQRSAPGVYPGALFWAAFNGVASGMLVLGFLPPLEQALNASTAFRLIELSDLNAPILRRLFTAAPGTYSHSIMVANLAEAACQDIGANPLLARVGAYYHDLGKMENPDYFVENQADYNRHDDMSPRLSVMVIRSHVKLGVEKARQLGLPREVIDIIGEHHGNSVISFFYSKALKQEDAKKITPEDYSYPGTPPRSKESAVVMLADMAEAAVRTLDKPTATKIEKFIQELIANKVEHGQLAQSELTFRDLETIKNAFVRVLAGYYHSRIEYPKTAQAETKESPEAAQK